MKMLGQSVFISKYLCKIPFLVVNALKGRFCGVFAELEDTYLHPHHRDHVRIKFLGGLMLIDCLFLSVLFSEPTNSGGTPPTPLLSTAL